MTTKFTPILSNENDKIQTKNSLNMVVDPAFRLMRFPLDGELDFLFEKLIFYLIKKMTWSRHLFLFYFLKV